MDELIAIVPDAEADRLLALARYEVLDTQPEPAFERIVRLAALLLDAPISLISLIDAERQWFKAKYGLDAPETPRAFAFCDHAIRARGLMVVPNAEEDPRFHDNPLVTGAPNIRFYAGAPLVTSDGFALGTLCAIDRKPRSLNAREAAILAALAEQVVHELEVRAALGELYKEVAEGRRTARTLQGEGAKLAALLNATGNAVVTMDQEGDVASLNRAAEAMFGVDSGEAAGWQMRRLISTDADESRGWRKDGSEFPIEMSRASWIDAQGCVASGAIVRDITERRNAEAELRRRDAAALTHEKLAALGRVAGGVAHELNNLLQPVIGLSQLELSQPVDGSPEQLETRESLEIILDSGNQMRDVVRKILLFARKAVPDLTPVDFPAAMRSAGIILGRQRLPDIRIDEVIDPALCGDAIVNEAELLEVLGNLVANAADAMDGCGTLSIRTDQVELTAQLASPLGLAPGAYFQVEVSDTGRGMDPATKVQALEPFFTTKPVGEGTGLGLSMVYGVLRNWNGAVAIDSTIGIGSTFTLYIPVTATQKRKANGEDSVD